MDSTKQYSPRFSIKKLEALVKIAVDNDLAMFEIGDIKIVPNHRKANPTPEVPLKIMREEERRIGRPLSEDDKINLRLGIGIITEEDES